MKALMTVPSTGNALGSLGVRDRSEMVLDTHLCSLVVSEGPDLQEAIGYGGFSESGDCVLSFLHAEVSGEKG